ncbi:MULTISPECIES: TlpA disulfide reductase family protein [unclassified Caballeronia]|uniref:TlpA family protein disulfide reductase n=1 Tax=unclassified Caballeronia TaxID=2646786 RepID=UPI001F2A5C1C|nr:MULTISPECIES: TlpA disulfide reductase family protein [unclassified Caballeronia]MCE4548128.1 TlpA family protein disulfide reductase [Caballeronia sp. PC1]MCE4575786.1 TlpA family protein disulfide reductase [Caballeronia sp. CLC5]
MQIGHLVIPLPPLIFLLAVFAALSVAGVLGPGRATAEADVAIVICVGLLVARLAFVARYVSDYGDLLQVLDVQDLGFDAPAGLLGSFLILAWRLTRKDARRLPVIVALLAGTVVYGSGQVLASQMVQPDLPRATLPTTTDTTEIIQISGKPTVINVWATWCPPCQAELPVFAQMQREMPGVNFIFLNEDIDTSGVRPYLEARGIRLDHSLHDPRGNLATRLSVRGYPTTLFYDRSGRLVAEHLGPFSQATLSDALKHLFPK